jgi:succinate dehydrogenase/fumarate reductase flavoprotein subunit
VLDLNKWGVPFKKRPNGKLVQEESFVPRLSTYARVIEFPGPLSGPPIALALRRIISQLNIHLLEYSVLTNLLTNQGEVVGGMILDRRNGDIYAVKAKTVVLATGACSEVYKVSLCLEITCWGWTSDCLSGGAEMMIWSCPILHYGALSRVSQRVNVPQNNSLLQGKMAL